MTAKVQARKPHPARDIGKRKSDRPLRLKIELEAGSGPGSPLEALMAVGGPARVHAPMDLATGFRYQLQSASLNRGMVQGSGFRPPPPPGFLRRTLIRNQDISSLT